MTDAASLARSHLAELHALASELDIPGYRMLRRAELIERILEKRPDASAEAKPAVSEGPDTTPVSGVLELHPKGYGFLRLSGPAPAEGDVYISQSQIQRCHLRPGDVVSGPSRPPRGREHYPALVHVDLVNGAEPGPFNDDSAE
jgi:transcription termination factor Rho